VFISGVLKMIIDILDLEMLETNLFRGHGPKTGRSRVFGGQIIGQALVAASRTVQGRSPHSLHAYFVRSGDPSVPIIYDVEFLRDGESFTTRNVVARQHGQLIYQMAISFMVKENHFDHQAQMPDVPAADDLPTEKERRESIVHLLPEATHRRFLEEKSLEIRPIDPPTPPTHEPREPVRRYWVRTLQPLPIKFTEHESVLAYASDVTIAETALAPHGQTWYSDGVVSASLDHAMWFHRDFRADQWLLFDQWAPSAVGGRGLNFGNVFSDDGRLIATVTQEGMMRRRR
tara:strand:- start:5350 stop:6213 length:864 start_codon:yes stop_codon:yes gene_type:complete